MGIVSVACTNILGLSFQMADISHPLGNYRVAIYATANQDWAQVARHVKSEGGVLCGIRRNLRNEWSVRQFGSYENVLDSYGHDNAPEYPRGKRVSEKGGLVLFRWHEVMSREGFDGDKRPVVNVSWYQARAFTLTAGEIYLLSDGEWEHAAEDVSPLVKPDGKKLVHCSIGSDETTTVDVDAPGFHVQKNGLMHMIGNVWEWTDENSTQERKYGFRGGSYCSYRPDSLRAAFRNDSRPDDRFDDIGFRVGASAP